MSKSQSKSMIRIAKKIQISEEKPKESKKLKIVKKTKVPMKIEIVEDDISPRRKLTMKLPIKPNFSKERKQLKSQGKHLTLLDVVKKPPVSWEGVFAASKSEFRTISSRIENDKKKGYRIFPSFDHIFDAFHLVSLQDVRLVIFGQDPYAKLDSYGKPEARGLAFSLDVKNKKVTPSLRNIYSELERSFRGFSKPDHGDISIWCSEGVLLLNASMTVREGISGSHQKLWDGFIKKVLDAIHEVNPDTVYFLWGNKAQELTQIIQGKRKYTSIHPSGFCGTSFVGNNNFFDANEFLKNTKRGTIDWTIPKREEYLKMYGDESSDFEDDMPHEDEFDESSSESTIISSSLSE